MKIPPGFGREDFRFLARAILVIIAAVRQRDVKQTTLDTLPNTAKQLLAFAAERKVFAFYADMGSGKTTLIKEICRHLGSHDNLSSPTYSIVNEYSIADKPNKIYHIDLYRLKNKEEAEAIGIEEYLYSGNYCFIEWPELIEDYLPDDVVKIYIKPDGDFRNVSIFIE